MTTDEMISFFTDEDGTPLADVIRANAEITLRANLIYKLWAEKGLTMVKAREATHLIFDIACETGNDCPVSEAVNMGTFSDWMGSW